MLINHDYIHERLGSRERHRRATAAEHLDRVAGGNRLRHLECVLGGHARPVGATEWADSSRPEPIGEAMADTARVLIDAARSAGGQDRGNWYYMNLAIYIPNYAKGPTKIPTASPTCWSTRSI
jgi:hypothetical protein